MLKYSLSYFDRTVHPKVDGQWSIVHGTYDGLSTAYWSEKVDGQWQSTMDYGPWTIDCSLIIKGLVKERNLETSL